MDTIKKILAPTDFSELSRAGVEYALMLARELGAEVTVYRAVSSEDLVDYTYELREYHNTLTAASANVMELHERALDRFLKRYVPDASVTINRRVELGGPADNIVELSARGGFDLIVMSTHGRTGLSHALYGSVTEKVVRHAPCPVLSIRPHLLKRPAMSAAA
jgi:universal stress protein A